MAGQDHQTNQHSKRSYRMLLLMLSIHFVVMFAVMYTMVNSFTEIHLNLNQTYMTIMMVTPMAATMILLMPSMYPDKKKNLMILVGSIAGFTLFFIFMRAQTLIGDSEFLRSMIPHHSGAVLMCRKASISDPQILKLCEQIIKSQTDEINQMEEMLKRY